MAFPIICKRKSASFAHKTARRQKEGWMSESSSLANFATISATL
jgi:hypothetical protein